MLPPAEFGSEAELEELLATNPQLLVRDGIAPPVVVARQVILPTGGRLDILCIDAEAVPVIVEAKLARNATSRREVIAQAIDYIASLASLTVEELDLAVGGALGPALRVLVDGDDAEFDGVWTRLAMNLRSARARFVLALDDVPPDLERIVRFLARHTQLDVQLLRIGKYSEASGNSWYVPALLIDETNAEREQPLVARNAGPSAVQAAVDALCTLMPGSALTPVGAAAGYRRVLVDGWPEDLHYEFVRRGRDAARAELHLEDESLSPLRSLLERIAKAEPAKFEWDPKWWKGCGRLLFVGSDGRSAADAALAMKALVERTRPLVNAQLATRSTSRAASDGRIRT